jgi:ABC-type transport system involved in cytochrome c biogenesis permease subunit
MSSIEILMSKVSFASLFTATSVYEYKMFFVDNKESDKIGEIAILGGNLSIATLLVARWIESGHFPLSNMYESLLFLAWGITSIQLLTNERNLSAVLGALTAPTALVIVAGATMILPVELQTATALVPALKSNWLMMHVSVMMMSYATLMVGSLACVSFICLDSNNELNELTIKKERNRPKVIRDSELKLEGKDVKEMTISTGTQVITKRRLMDEMNNLAYSCLT